MSREIPDQKAGIQDKALQPDAATTKSSNTESSSGADKPNEAIVKRFGVVPPPNSELIPPFAGNH